MSSKNSLGLMADIDEMMYSCGVEILHPGGLVSNTLKDSWRLYIQWLGLKGIVKVLGYIATNSRLRKGMFEYNRFFKDAKDDIGYGYFVGKKTM